MERNTELLNKYAFCSEDDKLKIEEELVYLNAGLVRMAAKRLISMAQGIDFEDLCQIGSIGLVKAVRRFDLSKNVAFSTYAVPMIIGEIKKFLRSDSPVKTGRTLKERSVHIKYASERLSKTLMRDPTLSEISVDTGLSVEEISYAITAAETPVSLDSSPDGSEFTLADTLSFEENLSVTDRIALRESLSTLGGDDRKLIVLRYFMEKTQQQTATILGMTQVQVSRREKKLLEQMRLCLI